MGKIDLDRFIASICKNGYGSLSMGDVKKALEEQSLEYKDDHIIEIEPDVVCTPDMKWFICTKQINNYKEGELYKMDTQNILCVPEYFRPATPEEISTIVDRPATEEELTHSMPTMPKSAFKEKVDKLCKPLLIKSIWPEGYAEKCAKEWAEDIPKDQVEKTRKLCEAFLKSTEEEFKGNNGEISPNSPAPQRDNYDEIKQAEPKQDTSKEMTEFEKYFKKLIGCYASAMGVPLMEQPLETQNDFVRKHASSLLSLARKQITSEIDAKEMLMKIYNSEYCSRLVHPYVDHYTDGYSKGITDTLKAIKGE